jgi:3-dehydroquinate synthase
MSIIKSTTYSVYIGSSSFVSLEKYLNKNKYTKYIIICDEQTMQYCLPTLLLNCEALNSAEIIEIESGENNKTIETCIQVWGALTDLSVDKNSLIINLGGGVISDLGGFVASTFKRGIDFINIPTTLLAMVDASVGGKNGIDFEQIKNHIGTINNPKAIFVNPVFLETLSERQIKNGYAEVIKIALIADKTFWKQLISIKNYRNFYSEKIITKAIELKNNIVRKDFKENDLRKSLNFGHTIGHALESSFLQCNNDILHGEAVAIGIIIESEIAKELKRISEKENKEIKEYIFTVYKKIKITKKIEQLILEYILHDKKNIGNKLCFSLPKSIGSYELNCGVTNNLITQAIKKFN